MDVLVTVVPGPRAVVGSFVLQKKTPFPDDEVIRRSKIKPKKQPTTEQPSRSHAAPEEIFGEPRLSGCWRLITAGSTIRANECCAR